MPAIRHFFRTNETPVYFVSATAFNLLGIDRWVRNFRFVNYYDSFDGWHPNVIVPKEQTPRAFESIEEIVNYLLGHKEIDDLVRQRGGGKAAFLMFDEETEELAEDLGLDVAFPPAALRHRMDSKIETTRLGNEAGVPSVPNTMGEGTDYPALLDAGARRRAWGTTSSCRPRTGTRGRRRSSSPTRTTGGEHERKIAGHDDQGDEADRAARARDRGGDHPARHARRAADGRAHRVPRADAVRRRMVRERRLARAAHRDPATDRSRAHDRDGRAPAPGGLPRATSSSTSCSTPTRARCGSAS